jgi:hypothetical protein
LCAGTGSFGKEKLNYSDLYSLFDNLERRSGENEVQTELQNFSHHSLELLLSTVPLFVPEHMLAGMNDVRYDDNYDWLDESILV